MSGINSKGHQKITVIFKFFKKIFVYLSITILSPFKVAPLSYNTLMPAFFPILETLLKCAFWYCQKLLFRFFFYLLNCSKTLYFLQCLQFWKEKKVSGGQVRWIRWLRHDYGFVFYTKTYAQALMCELVLDQNPWLVFHNSMRFWLIASRNRRITSR